MCRACGKDPKSTTLDLADGMENKTGLCPRVIADLHKFAAARSVIDEGQVCAMSAEEVRRLKDMVSVTMQVHISARVTLLFKSQSRLRPLGVGHLKKVDT